MMGKPNIIHAKQELHDEKLPFGPISQVSNNINKTLQPLSKRQVYEKMGYKDIKSAIKEFEEHHNKKVHLPLEDPFKATIKYGKYYSELDLLKLDWVTNNKTFQINITDIPIKQTNDQRTINFINGIKAYLTYSPNNYGLEFNKDGLHYLFLTYKNKNIPLQKIKELVESL